MGNTETRAEDVDCSYDGEAVMSRVMSAEIKTQTSVAKVEWPRVGSRQLHGLDATVGSIVEGTRMWLVLPRW